MNQVEAINNMFHYLDIVLVIASVGVGIFTIINPRKSWYMFQSKKLKTEAPNEKTLKNTRIFGVVILILSIVFIFIAFK